MTRFTHRRPATASSAGKRAGPLAVLFGLLLLFLPAAGRAAESAAVTGPAGSAALVSDTDMVSPGKPFHVGLLLRLAPGWHTYWRNPGNAGVPAELKLDLPDGAKAGPILWPAPRRIAEGPLMTYAYAGMVLLPVAVTPAPGGGATAISATANWLVCKNICIPEHGTFRLDLPGGTAAPSAQATLFDAALQAVPRPSPWAATVAPDGRLWVHGAGLGPASVSRAWFIPDRAGLIKDVAPQALSLRKDGLVLHLTPGKTFKPAAGLSGVLTVVDARGQPTSVLLDASEGAVPRDVSLPLFRMLVLAVLGGMILNLMPCVFPVLAMKALGLVQGAAHGRVRAHAVSYTLGVLVMFGVLGGMLMAARAAGVASGWGFQFQSPVFVAVMTWLLFAIGLNLSGVFQVGGGMAGIGQGLAARGGHLGSFFTGLLAVVVATPCTAPFMGAAIAGALAAPPAVTELVFLAMGAGLALPYVLISLVPRLAHRMPRPGRWMELLKQALAFPMYIAAAWLVWVISQEAGPTGVLGAVAGLVLVGFAAWALGVAQGAVKRGRHVGRAAAAAAMLGAAVVLGGIATAPASPAAGLSSANAEAFTPARLAALRAAGRPVFVDMTAAWCVTCLVNERVALDTEAVRDAFSAGRVAYLVGDWTHQDPGITAFLRHYGRDGVPLYVYFPPGGRPGIVLPQILTQARVLSAVRRG